MMELLSAYDAVRQHTLSLAAPLSEEDCCVQSMPDASPVKWHLAHTTWFFETFVLERFEPEFRAFHPMFRVLFNSYYNGIGEKHPRPQRGMLTRPSLEQVHAYRANIDERIRHLLLRSMNQPQRDELRHLMMLGMQHEQQHQELILTDVKHLLSLNPMAPAYHRQPQEHEESPRAMEWLQVDAALVKIGADGQDFCFDNETPPHRVFLESFALASRLVTNGEFRAFIEDGGYRQPALWLSEGWDWVRENDLRCPIYWRAEGDAWSEFTLNGLQPLVAERPVRHVSYFEADAYARWAGARLPTEAEWEHAAHRSERLSQLFGEAWQWTSSSYAPYPGFAPAQGAVGEYNGKFMVNQYVLRGSSAATPAGHSRITYRNFFPATARWQFTGIRLAKSNSR